jgi:hypothetical protein
VRQKRRDRHPAERPVHSDATPIDLGDTTRQIALFETGNGMQQGPIEIVVALLTALLLVPLRSFLRSGSKNRR